MLNEVHVACYLPASVYCCWWAAFAKIFECVYMWTISSILQCIWDVLN